MDCLTSVPRDSWHLPFLAEPEEVASLRRLLRRHLGSWGLHHLAETAQLCVSELVSNVIKHVGQGTPATLSVSMNRVFLRLEIHDPDTRALPALVDAGADSEGGRGMALVDGLADRWGVRLCADRKVTWCELATGLPSATGHCGGARVTRAESLLGLYGTTPLPRATFPGVLSVALAEEVAIDVIGDLLHWLRAHGCDADEALDRAQTCFEAESDGVSA
ncbi:ATP-binding protein [Streptomyces bungoensis]|uniref:ATP-binding protein n=1 Tax=Streptomyces bungoensis TaxID=285568 RepID=UPI0033F61FB5